VVPLPDASALARAAAVAGPSAVVESVRRLEGGIHAETHLIRLSNPELDVVLREFPVGDAAADDEARVLRELHGLDGLDGLIPRLLASEGDPAEARPWVLISRVHGNTDITPRDPEGWAAQLGVTLARLHASPPSRLTGLHSVLQRPGASRANLCGPAAEVVDESWADICAAPPVLTHSDFWSGNVVWDDDGVLSGVVDWSGGGTGPAGYDLGWCRLDLYLLFDEHIADTFLAAYQTATGAMTESSLWDLWAVARSFNTVESWAPNYRPLGRPDLTGIELRRRHTQWTTILTDKH
jgi:aminoglycoside phosphotransferase (APT) family kinase protein